MKPITINVSEVVYRLFQRHAKKRRRSTSELVREAMELYLHDRLENHTSLKDLHPLSLGRMKKSWDTMEEIGAELLDGDEGN